MAIYPFTQNKKFSDLFNRDFESYLKDEANKYTVRNLAQRLQYKIASLTTVTGKLDELTDNYLNGAQRENIVASM